MDARIDHVVLWVEDVERSLDFYVNVVGFDGVRVEEFRRGEAPFPSVRVSSESILDVMPRVAAPMVDAMSGAERSAGHPVNHVCLSMRIEDYEALRKRLEERHVACSSPMERSFGAQGLAPRAFYFRDPDGNVLEARYYDAPERARAGE
ncbi:MAG: VOC family protein [Candidatus Binatia bacterium]